MKKIKDASPAEKLGGKWRYYIVALLVLAILIITSGCDNNFQTPWKIIGYELYGGYEETTDANREIIGFGLLGNANYNQAKGVNKRIKVCYYNATGMTLSCTRGEDSYIIVNDLCGKNYNWIKFDCGDIILHISK